MSPHPLKIALILSLMLNIGVLGAAGFQLARGGSQSATDGSGVADSLQLDEEQRRQWREMESGFKESFRESWGATRRHREVLVRHIFSDQPDPAAIEDERRAILNLLEQQQKRVIAQLLAKRNILTEQQRAKLAEMLIRQEPAATVEQLVR